MTPFLGTHTDEAMKKPVPDSPSATAPTAGRQEGVRQLLRVIGQRQLHAADGVRDGSGSVSAAPRSELLPSPEAAALLGLKPQTLRKWRLIGTGPVYIRLGGPAGRVAYRRVDIDAWLEEHAFTSTSAEMVARATRSPKT